MKEEQNYNIPFQVETLLRSLLDKNERQHVRNNYRERLQSIRDVIDASLKKYDNENWLESGKIRKKVK